MAWLAHAKGLKKGQGKDSGKGSTMPSGASGKGTALAIEDAENQELASKLAKGKKLREGPAEDEKVQEENKEAVEPEPKTKKNDKNGEDEPKKKQKKNQNAEKGDESKKRRMRRKENTPALMKERKRRRRKEKTLMLIERRRKRRRIQKVTKCRRRKRRDRKKRSPMSPLWNLRKKVRIQATRLRQRGKERRRRLLGYPPYPQQGLMAVMMKGKKKKQRLWRGNVPRWLGQNTRRRCRPQLADTLWSA